jgi:hypothetical protein
MDMKAEWGFVEDCNEPGVGWWCLDWPALEDPIRAWPVGITIGAWPGNTSCAREGDVVRAFAITDGNAQLLAKSDRGFTSLIEAQLAAMREAAALAETTLAGLRIEIAQLEAKR